jgi:hypothetical protein
VEEPEKIEILTTEQIIPILAKAQQICASVRIKTSESLICEEADLPIPPYTLGAWIGNGNSRNGYIYGHKDDIYEMRTNIENDGFTLGTIVQDKRNDTCQQTILGLFPYLKKLDLMKNKHIPQIYMRSSTEQRLELLRGLMDTDGHADPNGGMEFYQKNKKLALQVFELVASLGMKPRFKSKIINGEVYHTIRFCTLKHEVFKMVRKQEVADLIRGHVKNNHFYIHEVRSTKSVPVRCIQVDNADKLFLCGKSMIPTHNTETTVGYILWKAMFTPDFTILITANNFAQALEIMQRVRFSYESMPNYIKDSAVEYNKSSISFGNGSRVVARATTPTSGKGLSISLLYVDEFAAIVPSIARSFWTAIRPTLSTGGSCIITSTPQNDEDQFAQLWHGSIDGILDEDGNVISEVGSNGFHGTLIPWYEHPERDEAWAETERASLGEAKFLQEHECRFITDDETLINPLTFSRMKPTPPEFYIGTSRWYQEPTPNKAYLVALDPSLGTEHDYAAIQIFQIPEMIQIAEWQSNKLAARQQVRVLMEMMYALDGTLRDNPEQTSDPEIFWTFENNTIGEGVLTIVEDTQEDRFPGQLVTERRRKGLNMKRVRRGLNTTPKNKLSACARLKSLIESDRMKINSTNLVKELKNFVSTGVSFRAKSGEHDDLVMSTLMIVRMLDIVLTWGTDAGDLREYIDDEELLSEECDAMPVVI